MTEAFLTGALLGLFASPHCMTMCGPLSWQAQSGIALRTLPYFTGLYHVGRISMYLVLGSLFWLLVDWANAPLYAGLAAGIFLLYTTASQWRDQRTCCPTARLLGLPLSKRRWGLKGPWYLRALGLGALNGLLPCAMVYAAIMAAAGYSESASESYLIGFGVATLVPLITFRYLWKRLVAWPGFKWVQLGLLVAVGLWMLGQSVLALWSAETGAGLGPHSACLPVF